MVLLIGGATHTGKTALAQRLLESRGWPYTSIDHLKMGLIRSGQTALTPADDEALTGYLWPIVREMAKTAVENGQNLVLDGCYIPFDWAADFDAGYLPHIRCVFLAMTRDYIEAHFDAICAHASDIERRLDDSSLTPELLIAENERVLRGAREHGCTLLLIDGDTYRAELPEL